MTHHVSAAKNIGPHLLGRVAPPPDARDWHLEAILKGGDDLDAVLAAILAGRGAALTTKAFAKAVVAHLHKLEGVVPAPPPPPVPPAPSTAVLWDDPDQLDQGQTPRCVGFGAAQFLNTSPINDHCTNADGDAIYAECKIIDGEPGQQNGSSVHSGFKALAGRARIGAYAWTTSMATIKAWLLAKGPLLVGTDWYNDMFNPDADGFVAPTGGFGGGHCWILRGYDPTLDVLTAQNSWGRPWGLNGSFKMKATDFDVLRRASGFECGTAIELSLI